MNPDKKLTRILCIDGGGVRGLIPAYFLSELEERFGIETFSAFDIIAGTSTGGILALCLTAPDISGKQAKFTARECLELYEKNSDAIFPKIRRFTRKIPPFKMFNPYTYEPDGLNQVLQKYLENQKLSACLSRVLIFSVTLGLHDVCMFDSSAALQSERDDYFSKDIARATSAAPTFFPPATITNINKSKTLELIDGGIVINNPSVAAFNQARKKTSEENILLVSLGTGSSTTRKNMIASKAASIPPLMVSPELIKIAMDGTSKNVHSSMIENLSPLEHPENSLFERKRYYRFQLKLEPDLEDMDNADCKKLRRLKRAAEEMFTENLDSITSLVKQLQ